MLNISLTAEDFKTLVSGGIVKREISVLKTDEPEEFPTPLTIQIALQDIGFVTMLELVNEVIKEKQ